MRASGPAKSTTGAERELQSTFSNDYTSAFERLNFASVHFALDNGRAKMRDGAQS
jgi:hypothetical protein